MSNHSLSSSSEIPVAGFSPSFSDLDQGAVPDVPHPVLGNYHPKLWELMLVTVLILATDVALLQQRVGYSGWSLWGLLVGIFLMLGIGIRNGVGLRNRLSWFLGATVLISSMRLIWQGDGLIVALLFFQLILLALTLHGLQLRGLPFMAFLVGWLPSGFYAMPAAMCSLSGCTSDRVRKRYVEWGVPLLIGLIFAAIFLKANPDSFRQFWDLCWSYYEAVTMWFQNVTFARVFVWSMVCLAGFGALLPSLMPEFRYESTDLTHASTSQSGSEASGVIVPYYSMFRNTLVFLIAIFCVYLFLEFQSMWFREFPDGFYYSGYAHQGAAWLTIALALTTVVLSIVFYHAPSIPAQQISRQIRRLRSLGFIWFLQNLLLAMCVYNRMFVYVGFNGMTRLRILGLLGITCVIVGLVLVLFRVYRGWTFIDLVYRQFWTMVGFLFAYLVLPTDTIVYRYNVRCIELFNARPSVQIVAHTISPSGILELMPLADASDEILRDGVRALLAEEMVSLVSRSELPNQNWRMYQHAESTLLERLESIRSDKLAKYIADETLRNRALERFRAHAMQWY
ncbi:MAG: DUF4173 domain-containing protein [Pirellula sp.]|jgi:hypothetical protein|nr:DUF4173 domain-containing protein [Pirellula sp.]